MGRNKGHDPNTYEPHLEVQINKMTSKKCQKPLVTLHPFISFKEKW
jgi:hypothetical protein